MARLARNLVLAQLAGEGKENCRSGSSNGELGRPYKGNQVKELRNGD